MASKVDIKKAAKRKEAILLDIASDQERLLRKSIESLEREVLSVANRFKVGADGRILTDKINLKLAAESRAELVRIFKTEYNKEFISSAVKDYDKVAVGVKKYYEDVAIPVSFTTTDIEVIKSLQLSAAQRLDTLGKQFEKAIAQGMLRATTVGMPFTDLVAEVQNSLRGLEDMRGVPMETHANVLANDSLMEMDATLAKKKAEDAGIDNFLYLGSLVKDSREFCSRHVGETHTKEEWERIGAGNWQGKKPGAFFVVRGGYRCGHQLLASPEDEVVNE